MPSQKNSNSAKTRMDTISLVYLGVITDILLYISLILKFKKLGLFYIVWKLVSG